MDKKIGVSILFSILILVGVVLVAKFAYGDALDTTTTAVVVYGDGWGNVSSDTTIGGKSEIVNVTVAYGDTANGGAQNITVINITWSGNYTFDGWVSSGDEYNDACFKDDPGECNGDNATFTNVTQNNDGSTGVAWSCDNVSDVHLGCRCTAAPDCLGPTSNRSLLIRFNATAASNIEDRNAWNITVDTNVVSANSTIKYTYVDGLVPRLVELNISDGNMTYNNGTFNGSIHSGAAVNTTYLDANSILTIEATFYELNANLNKMELWYNAENITKISRDLYHNETFESITDGTCSNGAYVYGRAADRGYTREVFCRWTIPARAAITAGGTNNETIAFGFIVNDTYNYVTSINDTSAMSGSAAMYPFGILTNDTLPHISIINVTDQNQNTITDLTGTQYLNTGTTMVFSVSGIPRAIQSSDSGLAGTNTTTGYIAIYYNTTGALTINKNGVVEEYDSTITKITQLNNVTVNENKTNLLDPGYTSLYSVDLSGIGNDTKTMEVAIVIGNASMDNLNGNYTTIAGPYSWIIDGATPSVEVTRVTESGGITQHSAGGVEYKCVAADMGSIQKYVWTLDRPGESSDYEPADNIIETVSTSNRFTFSGTDISVLGDYLVKCTVYDQVDNYATGIASGVEGFTVSAAVVTGIPSAAPGAPRITFDVDFSVANEGTVKAQQGRVKSFSFDGATKHTVTFVEVTANSATLKIESTPVTITLNVGETKDVDVNADGTNDMSVKLNEIKNSVADVTIKKIEEGAAKIVAEEEEARGVEEPTVTTPVVGAVAGLTWLWWLIGIIVIVALGYYFFFRKK